MFPVAILAGGLATRLRPTTLTTPKSLLDVNGEPFIAHQLRRLQASGIREVVLCVGYLGEMIRSVVSDGAAFGLRVEYCFDGDRLLGTGGAIKKALPRLSDSFFVLYGDSYLPCDFAAVQDAFATADKQALMTVFCNDDLWDRSNVEFADDQIIAYDKRERSPRMRFIDYGLGVFRASAFNQVPANEPADLADVYRDLLHRGELAGYPVTQRFYEIGTARGLEETAQYLAATGKGL